MTVELRKVAGGYVLFIPDALAAEAGLRDGVPIEADVMAEMLVVKEPAFVAAAREAMYARMTPDTFPDPHEPQPDWWRSPERRVDGLTGLWWTVPTLQEGDMFGSARLLPSFFAARLGGSLALQ